MPEGQPTTSAPPAAPTTVKAKVLDLIYWKNTQETAAVVGVGLFWFFLISWVGYASSTVLCYLALFHLVARLVYRNGCRILGDLNMIEKRPTQEAPTTFVTEEEVAKQLTTITAYVNSSLHAAYALALGESTSLVLKWIAGLWALALASKIFGTTGLFFLAFVGTFSVPKGYELKQPQIDQAMEKATAQVTQVAQQLSAKLGASSKDLLSKLPAIPKASDLKDPKPSNVKPKAL